MRRRIALVYRWTRDLHLYVGLFVSPFVVVFAISVLLLTRARLPSAQPAAVIETLTIEPPQAADDNLVLARAILERIGIAGEIDFISRNVQRNNIVFPVTRPGMRTMVRVDLTTGETRLNRRATGAWDAVVYLHKMPGPHNAAVRGNWVVTRIWGWLADASVALLLFVTASGIYLWLMLRGEFRTGLVLLGAGAFSFLACVLLVAA